MSKQGTIQPNNKSSPDPPNNMEKHADGLITTSLISILTVQAKKSFLLSHMAHDSSTRREAACHSGVDTPRKYPQQEASIFLLCQNTVNLANINLRHCKPCTPERLFLKTDYYPL